MTQGTHWKGCLAFGRMLLLTEDLDPVYIAIWKAKLNKALLSRLLVAYWCLYHLGVAASIAERNSSDTRFWKALQTAAVNPQLAYPRGAERRHWRGQQAIASAQDLINRFKSPEQLIEKWAAPGTFLGVTQRVEEVRGFGPWISFKVADMLERVAGYTIDFSDCELGFYHEPRAGAAIVLGVPNADNNQLRDVVQTLEKRLSKHRAPPAYDRSVNVQEMETILCKFKSFLNDHYPWGKDTREVKHGLHRWGDLAQELEQQCPKSMI